MSRAYPANAVCIFREPNAILMWISRASDVGLIRFNRLSGAGLGRRRDESGAIRVAKQGSCCKARNRHAPSLRFVAGCTWARCMRDAAWGGACRRRHVRRRPVFCRGLPRAKRKSRAHAMRRGGEAGAFADRASAPIRAPSTCASKKETRLPARSEPQDRGGGARILSFGWKSVGGVARLVQLEH